MSPPPRWGCRRPSPSPCISPGPCCTVSLAQARVAIDGGRQGGPCARDILNAVAGSAQPGPLGSAVVDTLAPVWCHGRDQVSRACLGAPFPLSGFVPQAQPHPGRQGPCAPVAGPNLVPSPQPEPPERQEGPDPEGAAGAAAPDHPAALLPAALPVLRPLLRVRTGPARQARPPRGGVGDAGPAPGSPRLFTPPFLPLSFPNLGSLNTCRVLPWV